MFSFNITHNVIMGAVEIITEEKDGFTPCKVRGHNSAVLAAHTSSGREHTQPYSRPPEKVKPPCYPLMSIKITINTETHY